MKEDVQTHAAPFQLVMFQRIPQRRHDDPNRCWNKKTKCVSFCADGKGLTARTLGDIPSLAYIYVHVHLCTSIMCMEECTA